MVRRNASPASERGAADQDERLIQAAGRGCENSRCETIKKLKK